MTRQPGVLLQGAAAVRQMEAMKVALAASKHPAPSSLSALLRACPDAFRMQARLALVHKVQVLQCSVSVRPTALPRLPACTQCTAQVERQSSCISLVHRHRVCAVATAECKHSLTGKCLP